MLHLDENDYYGAESASLNLKQLYKQFEGSEEKIDEDKLGSSKQYSIDLCPKFLMGCGNLVKMLLYTKVTRYLEFRSIDGSFVFKDKKLYPVNNCRKLNAVDSIITTNDWVTNLILPFMDAVLGTHFT